MDVRDPEGFSRVAAQILERHGHVDILINNAGVAAAKSFLETSDDDWSWTFETNLFGVIRGIRAFLPSMLRRGRGTIINVASLAGLLANTFPAYTASKFSVVGLSESLLIEHGDAGLKVVVVCPGFVNTEILSAGVRAGRVSDKIDIERLQQQFRARGVSPDVIARDIVRAADGRRFLVLSPAHASALNTFHRWFPSAARWVTRKMLR